MTWRLPPLRNRGASWSWIIINYSGWHFLIFFISGGNMISQQKKKKKNRAESEIQGFYKDKKKTLIFLSKKQPAHWISITRNWRSQVAENTLSVVFNKKMSRMFVPSSWGLIHRPRGRQSVLYQEQINTVEAPRGTESISEWLIYRCFRGQFFCTSEECRANCFPPASSLCSTKKTDSWRRHLRVYEHGSGIDFSPIAFLRKMSIC